jgi:hypothetical protein
MIAVKWFIDAFMFHLPHVVRPAFDRGVAEHRITERLQNALGRDDAKAVVGDA